MSTSDLTDDQLAAAIDACFGDGPAPQPLEPTLLAGRRARRRRTTVRAVGAAGGAGLVAAAAAALLVVPDGTPTGSSPGWDLGVASSPSPGSSAA